MNERRFHRSGILLFLLLLLSALATCPAQKEEAGIPEIRRRVTDLTNTLSAGDVASLEDELAAFEHQTSNQIVVLIVPSLGDQSLEEYSLAVAEKNKLGKKGRDNGVLLIIAMEDRKARIEVGYGLEGALTDAVSSQIIRQVIAPKFREGEYCGGLDAGIKAIMLATRGEFKGEPETDDGKTRLSPFVVLILFLLFGGFSRLFLSGTRRYVGSRGYYTRRGWWGGGFGGFGGGGFGGGGFGGGGFGGGGFSGGGGSFGGGGASGGW